jgi:TldD protein
MNIDLADFAVKYAVEKGASYAEARLEHSSGDGFALRNGNLDISGIETVTGIGCRILVGGSNSFISTNRMEKPKIRGLINDAVKTTKASARLVKEKVKFSEEPIQNKKYEAKEKIKLSETSSKEKLELLLDLEKIVMSLGIRIPARYMGLGTSLTEKYFTNSEGSKIWAKIPRIELTYLITILHENQTKQRIFQFKASKGWEVIKEWKLREHLTDECRNLYKVLKDGVAPPKGELDVVVGPEITGIACHESSGHPSEADRILGREGAQAGESFMTPDIIGKKIGIPELNIVDDPTIPGSAGFYLFDEEGVEARKRFLVKDGKINEFLHNRRSAKLMGIKSNGSARATGYSFEPIIRMANTFALPGNHSLEELIEGVKRGVYIKSFMEWNIDDLRKNVKYVGNEAYLIENGKITNPVKSPVIETTTLNYWSSVDAIGKKTEFSAATCGKGEPQQGIPIWHGGPAMRLRKLRLGGISHGA